MPLRCFKWVLGAYQICRYLICQYAVSPTNPAFIKEYRAALQAFIAKHRNDADPDVIQDYERELNKLSQAQN